MNNRWSRLAPQHYVRDDVDIVVNTNYYDNYEGYGKWHVWTDAGCIGYFDTLKQAKQKADEYLGLYEDKS